MRGDVGKDVAQVHSGALKCFTADGSGCQAVISKDLLEIQLGRERMEQLEVWCVTMLLQLDPV